jgi:hypothetical protein
LVVSKMDSCKAVRYHQQSSHRYWTMHTSLDHILLLLKMLSCKGFRTSTVLLNFKLIRILTRYFKIKGKV